MQDFEDPFVMPDADVRAMRDQLFHTYTATDRVTEFLTQRECNSRMLYTTPEFKIVDVRLEPTCRWMNVYYSIVEHGKVRCREQFPMLWETFRKITADKDVNRVKNPWTMETSVYNYGMNPRVPPRTTLRPLCRMVTPEEAIEILQKQARALNDDDDEIPR
jgi:hypothetical protein